VSDTSNTDNRKIETQMSIEINADVILANLFANGSKMVNVRDLNAAKDALAKSCPDLYVDVSGGSLCMAVDERPDLFCFSYQLEDTVFPVKEITKEYVEQHYNWRIPEKYRGSGIFEKTLKSLGTGNIPPTRKLWVIKDTTTGKYITSASVYVGSFEDAVLHTTEKSVQAGVKRRVRFFKEFLKNNPQDESEVSSWRSYKEIKERSKLPAFGLEIVELTATVSRVLGEANEQTSR
jgi:hypothetical protein